MQGTVRSADGTSIAFEQSGNGPALVMVDPAGGYSGFGAIRGLGAVLAARFTVCTYDRRGRGGSGDTPPYTVEREVEDLSAVIAAAGGAAFVYGLSSGGLLALRAAARGLAITRLALFEPPVRAEGEPPDTAFTAELADLVSSGHRAAAVDRLLTSIGVPPELRAEPSPALEAVAHTLVYDCEISDATTFQLIRSVRTPTLVLASKNSTGDLTDGAAAVAAALPGGVLRELPGSWHTARDEDIAAAVTAFFLS
ncbi:alpha/beta fold hydrolase [Nonomuraea diastatica]|uniref:Alpha/beta fold hydrolase n=1 Tax=Nonomuraea diastatica TaxID=1848329 RepID=A0A4R4X0F7_9ACTN|nr:alpha/beta fold hydrolase [Nonomuraea diastatica]TDD23653.1 alpha/beta fold hydrolase [Nonomuraea diastatica]